MNSLCNHVSKGNLRNICKLGKKGNLDDQKTSGNVTMAIVITDVEVTTSETQQW